MSYSKHIYAPKPGDEVKWPNGLVMRFDPSVGENTIVVTGVPEDDTLIVGSYEGNTWLIGVSQ